jgi:MOB kinase activator 1
MTSFIQTMLVNSSPPRSHFPQAAKPLPALHCNLLAASESSSPIQWLESPQSVYHSPLQRHFRDVLDSSPSQSPLSLHPPHSPLSNNAHARPKNTRFTRTKDQPIHAQGHAGGDSGHDIDKSSTKANPFSQSSNANARTRGAFKPQRAQKGTNSWQLKQFAEATLGSGSLKKVVRLPEGEDKNEWLAINGMWATHRPCYSAVHLAVPRAQRTSWS